MTHTYWRHRSSGDVYLHNEDAGTLTGPIIQAEYMLSASQLRPAWALVDWIAREYELTYPDVMATGEYDADDYTLWEGPYAGTILYSAADTAELLGITVRRVRALARSRSVGQQLGRAWIFEIADVEAMRDREPGRPHAALVIEAEGGWPC